MVLLNTRGLWKVSKKTPNYPLYMVKLHVVWCYNIKLVINQCWLRMIMITK